MKNKNLISRRTFLESIGAAGLGSALASAKNDPNDKKQEKQTKSPQVSKRKLGKTNVEISELSLGANRLDNTIILRNCTRWGITLWDTSNSYVGGNSEINIGRYISANSEIRKKLFIVTKASRARSIEDIEKRLQTSLKRMNTKYIDLYYGVHGLDEPDRLTNELKQWVSDAKKRGLIKFFGFSTHENMAENLLAAAKLDWIDALMTSYNFRLMQDKKMQQAIDACHKAGIGIIAMKTLGLRTDHKIETDDDKKIAGHFLEKGYTQPQAALKAVLQDNRISSACVGMRNITELTSNVAAVLDKKKLSEKDLNELNQFADATSCEYCTGCSRICNAAIPETPYVSKIMRYLMYYNSYSDQEGARELFAQIPRRTRAKLLKIDYRKAEKRCPQNLPITKLMAEAVRKLS